MKLPSGASVRIPSEGNITLWLDDLRPPEQHGYVGATWVKTPEDAIALLQLGSVKFASLDHDLTIEATMGYPVPDEETGYAVVRWLEDHPEFWPRQGVKVHSLKPGAKQKMQVPIRQHYGRIFE